MTTDPRRRLRRILLLAAIPFALAGLVFAVKLLSLGTLGGLAVENYRAGNVEKTIEQSDELMNWNVFEPWIAWFDRGTANAAGGNFNEATRDLEQAFSLAPKEKRCDVAVNLSLSWERQGDSYLEQGQYAGAKRLYETADAVITAAGPECEPPNAPKNTEEDRDPGQELSDARERLADKGRLAEEQDEVDAGGDDEADPLDQLEEQNDEAAREKAEQEGQDRGDENAGTFTDKPW